MTSVCHLVNHTPAQRVQGFTDSLASCPDEGDEGLVLLPGNGMVIPTPA